MSYNGWANKETWLVNLWLGDSLSMFQEDGDTIDSDYIEFLVDEIASALLDSPDSNGFMTDLLNCALGEINYYELAKHYQEESD